MSSERPCRGRRPRAYWYVGIVLSKTIQRTHSGKHDNFGGDPEGRLDRVLGLFLRLAWSTQETNVYKQKAAEMWLRLKSGPNLVSAFLWFVLLWLRKLERARSKCPRHQDLLCSYSLCSVDPKNPEGAEW